jgi:hypothetical protein
LITRRREKLDLIWLASPHSALQPLIEDNTFASVIYTGKLLPLPPNSLPFLQNEYHNFASPPAI